ncbi:hypothetical protein [Aureimonas sp. AU12]|uniref:hypothetical protein n=1 Tax=Aureimonas sp. AU12 TaxID=1638161 RepID=UPI000ABBFFB3|nr:hypothetical protein [Aureimonas sp. AU12]
MDEIAADEGVAIWTGRACTGCQRPSAIAVAIDRLRALGPLSSTDVEDAAMLACGACLAEVQCIREDGAWALQLARAEAAAAA